jgi:hypothetical protein
MAMLRFMNYITDLPDWYLKVLETDHSFEITGLQRQDLKEELISSSAWDWCLAELRDKAAVFCQSGLVPVFNSASAILESDSLVTHKVLDNLRSGVSSCLARAGKS